jgi:hypothetical protein
MRLVKFVWRYRVLWAILAMAIGLAFRLVTLVNVGGNLLLFLLVMMGFESTRQSIIAFIAMKRISEEIKRTSQGRCAVCGYDLRASKLRCPECGTRYPAAVFVQHTHGKTRSFRRSCRLSGDGG